MSTSSDWPVAYYAANGSSPLMDTDGDSLVDTGPIAAGSSTKIIARYTAPAQAVEGDDNSAHIQLTSSLDNLTTASVHLGMSVSSGFATVFQDEYNFAMSFLTASKAGTTLRKVTADGYGGDAPAVARLGNGTYLYAWDKFHMNSTGRRWNDMEYAVIHPNGTVLLPATTLVDNSGAAFSPYDVDPSIAVAPDGTVGIVWQRTLSNLETGQYNYNIFFATLNASGTRLTGPTNITNNTAWSGSSDYNYPRPMTPTIAATSDNRFIISWTDNRRVPPSSYENNIWYAAYNTAGVSVKAPTPLTFDNTSHNPILNPLSNSTVILLWGNYGTYHDVLTHAVIGSNGGIVKPETVIGDSFWDAAITWPTTYDAVLLPSGKIAVAWINGLGVEFAILNASYNLESGPHQGNNEQGGDGFSITTNAAGHVIMTWVEDFYKLSYAVGDSSGAYLTDPMVYYTTGEYIYVNRNGQGSAPFSPETAPTFVDVGTDYWAWQFVERLVNAGVTAGCGEGRYCPDAPVTRDQMAVFLLKAKHGKSYTPPALGSGSGFGDVPTGHWAAAWIKQLAAEGITGGCGGGNYCPGAPVTRDQMAVFLLKARYGKSYTPPALGSGSGFTDVPPEHWAAAWIKQLAAEGITGGCGAGIFCPGNPVNRAEMAVFLVRTFNLP
jgi:hypothetical protein